MSPEIVPPAEANLVFAKVYAEAKCDSLAKGTPPGVEPSCATKIFLSVS